MNRRNQALRWAAAALFSWAAASGSALAQPVGPGPFRVVAVGTAAPEDVAAAREFVGVMYHGDTDADTADWLSERLMDRYRRAFDLFDNIDDPAVQSAKMDYLKSLPARVHKIVDPRVPEIRAFAIGSFAARWRGDQMVTLLTFARTEAGRRYLGENPVLDGPALASLAHDNMELANEVIKELSERLGTRFTGDPKYTNAFIAAASGV